MISPTQHRVTEERRQELLAEAVRLRTVASRPSHSAAHGSAGRALDRFGHVVALLVALVSRMWPKAAEGVMSGAGSDQNRRRIPPPQL